ncbi:MAG: glycosyltransferase family 39 protein, partial [Chloroflexi bacterium]|nr:glycosyltransferase family 39 protein [Chloroflexota bacterium]
MSARLRSPWVIAGLLFVLALLPRVIDLGSYVTHDEPFWLLNSIRCIYGLTHGDMSAAFQSAHPGVPPLIGHGALLWLYYTATGQPEVITGIAQSGWVIWFPPHLNHLLPEMIAVAGWFTAVVSALTVAAAYLLVRRLTIVGSGPRAEMTALFAGLLLAVDPYFLALSRVVGVDAALAGFMLLSALLLLVYMADPSRWLALLGAGALMALAFLTKTSAAFLVPFTMLILGSYVTFCLLTDRPAGWSGRRWLLMAVLWAVTGVCAFLGLWPAAWQDPITTVLRLVHNLQAVVTTPHESASYFMGQFILDPGLLYYWVVLAFRLTPLTMPLVLLAVGLLVSDAGRRRWRLETTLMLSLLLYAVLFLVMMSLAAKKQERYILPALLAL